MRNEIPALHLPKPILSQKPDEKRFSLFSPLTPASPH